MNSGTGKYEQLLERCAGLAPVPTAVVYPCEETVLTGALEAGRKGLIIPILVGPAAKIQGITRLAGIALGETRIIDTPHSHGSAAKAVEMIREGCAEVLMKGSLHTDELLSAVITREAELRTARRISHAFIMDVPRYCKVLIVTDTATNISPALEDKSDIRQNAIDLAVSLGLEKPRVAILAAALCKMADRGQITRGIPDAPLAFDNAISKVPDLEAGNILARQLIFLANAESAGLILGARVPIILTSRADSVRSRIASCAVAMAAAHARRKGLRVSAGG